MYVIFHYAKWYVLRIILQYILNKTHEQEAVKMINNEWITFMMWTKCIEVWGGLLFRHDGELCRLRT